MSAPICIYVDVDDTLVRSVGSKRIPIPSVIRHVGELHREGAILYCSDGKRPVGGGSFPSLIPYVDVAMVHSDPLVNGWRASSVDTNGGDTEWLLTIYAICADIN